ncbi:MAG: hypothetical protein U1F71_23640 [Verrucomicrobiaceae bacterium]
MNTQSILLILSLSLVTHLAYADDPKSGYHGMAGPNGGRLLVEVEPHIEFLVKSDTKKVEIRFVGDALIVLPPAGQEVTTTVGEGDSATKLTFTQQGDKLVSDVPLPAGDRLPVTVQIRAKPGDSSVTAEKFILDLGPCPTGKHLKYACTCERDQQAKAKEQK